MVDNSEASHGHAQKKKNCKKEVCHSILNGNSTRSFTRASKILKLKNKNKNGYPVSGCSCGRVLLSFIFMYDYFFIIWQFVSAE